MRRMYDAAYPPSSPPSWEVCAFYIGGDTPHVWTTTEVTRQKARYRLPIWVRSNPKGATQGAQEGKSAVAWLKSHGAMPGSAVVIDFETAVDQAYLDAFDSECKKAGFHAVDYGSRSFVTRMRNPSGGRWSAEWTGSAHLASGDAATQYADDKMLGTSYDGSLVADSLVLWDTHSHPLPPPKAVNPIEKVLSKADSQNGYHSSGDSKYGDWYAARVKDGAFKTADWCDMFVSWCGFETGLEKYIGIFAYVPSHRNWFIAQGRYHHGTSGIKRGDILFMDFVGGSEGSHIGYVESAGSDGVHTIEGNTGGGHGSVLKRTRTVGIIGYGRPAYPSSVPGPVPTPTPTPTPTPSGDWLDKVMATLPDVSNGSTGKDVETVQGLCNARLLTGQTLLKIDGDFGPKTETTVRDLQSHFGAGVDGVVGPQTWRVLITGSHV